MIEFLFVLVLFIVLFAIQDVIAWKVGWFIDGPSKSWYVVSTIFIMTIVRLLVG